MIFDPLGFVCLYVIVAKILLQELWRRGYDWDDEVQDEIANKIGAWFEKLKSLREVKIPRCLRSSEPVKSRLELMGAILGLRLTQSLLTVLEAPMQRVTFYSDSTDVLWWIRGRGKDFQPFVANRIGKIQMFTEPSQWQHASTDENPDDLCTGGATPSELAECSLWWNGPDWLTKDFSEWSKMQVPNKQALV